MPGPYYTAEQTAWIKENFLLAIADFHAAFVERFGIERSRIALNQKRSMLGLKTGRSRKDAASKKIGSKLIVSGYLYRKVSSERGAQHENWRCVHLLRWENLNGRVPPGMLLRCRGDRLNTDPSNWDLISMAMGPDLNGFNGGLKYTEAPPEMKPTLMALAKLRNVLRQARQKAATNP